MRRIRNYIRYSSSTREYLYKFLKLCDRFPLYNILYRKRIKSKTSQTSVFPGELSIETTNLCNAQCTICTHPQMQRKKGKMETDLVRSLITQAGENRVKKLFLSGFGEPLLDKRLPEFISLAREQNINDISIVTNGYLLTREAADDLVEAGLNQIIISIDGFTAQTYEKIRVGLDFEKLEENIKNLSSLKYCNKVDIQISCVNLIHNLKERKIAYSRFGSYVDSIIFRQAQGWTEQYGKESVGYSPHYNCNNIPCRYLWDSASVYIDGAVPACCLDYEAEGVMGNVYEKSIKDIWQGDRFRYYREMHVLNRKSQLEPCRKCGYYSVWW